VARLSRKQNQSLELWSLDVSTEELEMIRIGLSTRALHLETPPVIDVHVRNAHKYRQFNQSLSLQLEEQREGGVEREQHASQL